MKDTLVRLLTADVDVVRKVERMDQRQREVGHDLRNIEQRLEPLTRLVERMRNEE